MRDGFEEFAGHDSYFAKRIPPFSLMRLIWVAFLVYGLALGF